MDDRNHNRDAFTLVLALVALACTVFLSYAIADDETPKPFWNRYSVQFMYAPAFEFPSVGGAVRYRFVVTDDILMDHTFESDKPTDRLTPVWDGLPVGYAKLTVYGLDAQGRICGISGERRFWRSAPFVPDVPWSYGEAATRYYAWLFEQPNTVSFREKGVPNGGNLDLPEIYPSKMNSSLICAMVRYAKRCPERRTAALKTACNVGDYMLSIAQPPTAPLAHFTPTYWKKENQRSDFASIRYRGQNMLVYPAHMAEAYLDLFEVTGDTKYRDAAFGIAATYERLQLPNGTWYLKLWEKDASPVLDNGNKEPFYLIPVDVCAIMLRLAKETGDDRWEKVFDRAFAYLEQGPLATYDWAAQFEDTEQTRDYIGQCSLPPMRTAMLLLKRYPGDAKRLEQAQDLAKWVEDQFVAWRRPCRSDGRGILSEKHEGFGPQWDGSVPKDSFDNWVDVPNVSEKYAYMQPENILSADLIRLYLELYRVTGEYLLLQKARALGDGLVKFQAMHGGRNISTHYWKNDGRGNDGGNDWTNCGVGAALGLEALSELDRCPAWAP